MVVGVDATQGALPAMQAGELNVAVLQDAAAQGAGGLDVALALVRGAEVDGPVHVPFDPVAPGNMADHLAMRWGRLLGLVAPLRGSG